VPSRTSPPKRKAPSATAAKAAPADVGFGRCVFAVARRVDLVFAAGEALGGGGLAGGPHQGAGHAVVAINAAAAGVIRPPIASAATAATPAATAGGAVDVAARFFALVVASPLSGAGLAGGVAGAGELFGLRGVFRGRRLAGGQGGGAAQQHQAKLALAFVCVGAGVWGVHGCAPLNT
jgi:hypothetical protein